jgi:SAM-dependent methyltransferase
MPVHPPVLERLAFTLNAAPAPVFDYIGALGLRAVCVAERLGVFATLEESPCSAAELAARLRANERGIRALLDALAAVGYLRRRGDRYAPTPMAARWIPRLRDGMGFFEWMAYEGWAGVEASLWGESPADGNGRPRRIDEVEELFGGMLSNARLAADEVPRRVRTGRSARRLLDVGSGHGLYSARFCALNPQLRATLVDRAPELEQARAVLAQEGVADRAELRPGDFWTDDLGAGYDVVLLFNLLNAYPADQKVALLRRAADSLAPTGTVVVLDQMRSPALRGTARAIVELTNLRLFDPEQRDTYALAELRGWLAEAGLRPHRTGTLRSVPWMCFVAARREARPLPGALSAARPWRARTPAGGREEARPAHAAATSGSGAPAADHPEPWTIGP